MRCLRVKACCVASSLGNMHVAVIAVCSPFVQTVNFCTDRSITLSSVCRSPTASSLSCFSWASAREPAQGCREGERGRLGLDGASLHFGQRWSYRWLGDSSRRAGGKIVSISQPVGGFRCFPLPAGGMVGSSSGGACRFPGIGYIGSCCGGVDCIDEVYAKGSGQGISSERCSCREGVCQQKPLTKTCFLHGQFRGLGCALFRDSSSVGVLLVYSSSNRVLWVWCCAPLLYCQRVVRWSVFEVLWSGWVGSESA